MSKKTLKLKVWYKYAVAICIGVVLFVALTHLDVIWSAVKTFIGFFKPVIFGCIIAYIVNPLASLYTRKLPGGPEKIKMRGRVGIILAYVTIRVVIVASLAVLIPQLVSSVTMFADNLDEYIASLTALLKSFGLSASMFGLHHLTELSDDVMGTVSGYISKNLDDIMTVTAGIGLGAVTWMIALLLSMYILAEKSMLKSGLKNLLQATLEKEQYVETVKFLSRSNNILNRYIVFNLVDAFIIGMLNMLFLTVMGFPYAGLVAFVAGLTNLIPTFGPFVGGAIGAFILLLVEPWYAAAFLAFTVAIQIFDGYILKPKLFGKTLGVSGMWILVGIVVGGNMFGVVGILIGIPVVAILDDIYHEYLLPLLEKKKWERSQ